MIGSLGKWMKLDIPFYWTAAGQHSFLYRDGLWNDLDNNTKNCSSIRVFKNSLERCYMKSTGKKLFFLRIFAIISFITVHIFIVS